VEYFLTDKGKSLLPIIVLMKEWGDAHVLNRIEEKAALT
jgi:DNA-binding HxlR family transcriptional regulator